MIHLLPHWNQRGAEGRRIPVWIYSNCEEAELFLNGQSLGRRRLMPFVHEEWQVPFEAGKISAVGYIRGEKAAEDIRETTGRAAALKLIVNSAGDRADGRDVARLTCAAVDAVGREVPDATPTVSFAVNHLGKILGTGSDVCDHIPVCDPVRRMWAGRAAVCIGVGREPGIMTVTASSPGLGTAYLDIELKEETPC